MDSQKKLFTEDAVDGYEVIAQLFQRYADMVSANTDKLDALPLRCQSKPLLALCNEAINNGTLYPFDKMNRWLGFVQGVLAVVGIIDVDQERDVTRPLLHKLHNRPIRSWPPKA